MNGVLTWSRPASTPARLGSIGMIGLIIGLVTFIVYVNEGTSSVWPHLMYLPVVLAAVTFEPKGGVLAAVVGGLALGPWMPLDLASGISQDAWTWIMRIGFFAGIGMLVGEVRGQIDGPVQTQEHHAPESNVLATVVTTFGSALEVRDQPTGEHSRRVASNARTVGRLLGLRGPNLDMLEWGAFLHDLGKISVPDRVLLKPGPLSPEEYRVIQQHAEVGADLIEAVDGRFVPVARAVRHHHERWDGTGYPDGLIGEHIPFEARIVAVVDVFEALTTRRPYREPIHPDEALRYLLYHRGTHFDPSVVVAFADACAEDDILVDLTAREPPPSGRTSASEMARPDATVIFERPAGDRGESGGE